MGVGEGSYSFCTPIASIEPPPGRTMGSNVEHELDLDVVRAVRVIGPSRQLAWLAGTGAQGGASDTHTPAIHGQLVLSVRSDQETWKSKYERYTQSITWYIHVIYSLTNGGTSSCKDSKACKDINV